MGTVNALLLPTSSGIALQDAWQLSVLKLIFFYFVELDIVFFFSLLWLLQEFAMSLRNRVSSISVMPKIRTLTFVLDACKMLEQARKVRLDNLLRFRLNSVSVLYAVLKIRRCQPCSIPNKGRQNKREWRNSIRAEEEVMSAFPCSHFELGSVFLTVRS